MLPFSYMAVSSQAVNRLLHLSNRPAGKAEDSNTLNGFFKVIDKKILDTGDIASLDRCG